MEEKTLNGYIAIVLDSKSRNLLLEKFPPKHNKTYAHHSTVFFKPTDQIFEEYQKMLGKKVNLNIVGYAEDDRGQVVTLQHPFKLRNRKPHITISVNGVPAKYSNELLDKANQIKPIELSGKLEFINNN